MVKQTTCSETASSRSSEQSSFLFCAIQATRFLGGVTHMHSGPIIYTQNHDLHTEPLSTHRTSQWTNLVAHTPPLVTISHPWLTFTHIHIRDANILEIQYQSATQNPLTHHKESLQLNLSTKVLVLKKLCIY